MKLVAGLAGLALVLPVAGVVINGMVAAPAPQEFIQEYADLNFTRLDGIDRTVARAQMTAAGFKCEASKFNSNVLICVQHARAALLLAEIDTVTILFDGRQKVATVKIDKKQI